jgi:hypothetical protein
MTDLEAKQKKDRIKEIVAYSICGVLWLGGLALCILGVYAFNGPGKITSNPIYIAQKNLTTAWHLNRIADFRILGAVVCLLSMCLFLIFVNVFANRYEKDQARRSRQEARLQQLLDEDAAKEKAAIAEAQANQVSLPKEETKEAEPAGPAPLKKDPQ